MFKKVFTKKQDLLPTPIVCFTQVLKKMYADERIKRLQKMQNCSSSLMISKAEFSTFQCDARKTWTVKTAIRRKSVAYKWKFQAISTTFHSNLERKF